MSGYKGNRREMDGFQQGRGGNKGRGGGRGGWRGGGNRGGKRSGGRVGGDFNRNREFDNRDMEYRMSEVQTDNEMNIQENLDFPPFHEAYQDREFNQIPLPVNPALQLVNQVLSAPSIMIPQAVMSQPPLQHEQFNMAVMNRPERSSVTNLNYPLNDNDLSDQIDKFLQKINTPSTGSGAERPQTSRKDRSDKDSRGDNNRGEKRGDRRDDRRDEKRVDKRSDQRRRSRDKDEKRSRMKTSGRRRSHSRSSESSRDRSKSKSKDRKSRSRSEDHPKRSKHRSKSPIKKEKHPPKKSIQDRLGPEKGGSRNDEEVESLQITVDNENFKSGGLDPDHDVLYDDNKQSKKPTSTSSKIKKQKSDKPSGVGEQSQSVEEMLAFLKNYAKENKSDPSFFDMFSAGTQGEKPSKATKAPQKSLSKDDSDGLYSQVDEPVSKASKKFSLYDDDDVELSETTSKRHSDIDSHRSIPETSRKSEKSDRFSDRSKSPLRSTRNEKLPSDPYDDEGKAMLSRNVEEILQKLKSKQLPSAPAEPPPVEKKEESDIEDEDLFLYGESSGRRKSNESHSKKRQTSRDSPIRDQSERDRRSSSKNSKDNQVTEVPKIPASVMENPTIQNILSSIGFDFEMSKRMQNRAKERQGLPVDIEPPKISDDMVVNETSSFLNSGLSGADLDDALYGGTSRKNQDEQSLRKKDRSEERKQDNQAFGQKKADTNNRNVREFDDKHDRDSRQDERDRTVDSRDTRDNNREIRQGHRDSRHDDRNSRHDDRDARQDDRNSRHDDRNSRHDDRNSRHDDRDSRKDNRDSRHDDRDLRRDDRDSRHDDRDVRNERRGIEVIGQDNREARHDIPNSYVSPNLGPQPGPPPQQDMQQQFYGLPPNFPPNIRPPFTPDMLRFLMPPSQFPPHMLPGQIAPGQILPGQMPPSSIPPGQFPPTIQFPPTFNMPPQNQGPMDRHNYTQDRYPEPEERYSEVSSDSSYSDDERRSRRARRSHSRSHDSRRSRDSRPPQKGRYRRQESHSPTNRSEKRIIIVANDSKPSRSAMPPREDKFESSSNQYREREGSKASRDKDRSRKKSLSSSPEARYKGSEGSRSRKDSKRQRSPSKSQSRSLSPSPKTEKKKVKKEVKGSEYEGKSRKTDTAPQLSKEQVRKLKIEHENREKRLQLLQKELDALKRQQNELMRKKQRQKDGHKDPILVENTQLQEEISRQISLLREMSDRQILEHMADDDVSPPDVKKRKFKEVMEEQESDVRAALHGDVSTPHHEKSSKSRPIKVEDPVKSAVDKVKYEYFDPGNHWCKLCNHISSNVYEVFTHLQSKKHQQNVDPYDRPWMPDSLKNPSMETDDKMTVQVAPIKGIEFLMSTVAFYCTLCESFSGDVTCADDHLKTELHNKRYKEHIKKNAFYERRLNMDKAAGLSQAHEEKIKTEVKRQQSETKPLSETTIAEDVRRYKEEGEKERRKIQEQSKFKNSRISVEVTHSKTIVEEDKKSYRSKHKSGASDDDSDRESSRRSGDWGRSDERRVERKQSYDRDRSKDRTRQRTPERNRSSSDKHSSAEKKKSGPRDKVKIKMGSKVTPKELPTIGPMKKSMVGTKSITIPRKKPTTSKLEGDGRITMRFKTGR